MTICYDDQTLENSLDDLSRKLKERIDRRDDRAGDIDAADSLTRPSGKPDWYWKLPDPDPLWNSVEWSREADVDYSDWTRRFYYYGTRYLTMVQRCALILGHKANEDMHLGFCFALAWQVVHALALGEPVLALLAQHEEKKKPYKDHIFHVFNTYFIGNRLLKAKPKNGQTGFQLLLAKIRSSGSAKHFFEKHLSLDRHWPHIVTRAWRIAALCHDIGFLAQVVTGVESLAEWKALDSGKYKFAPLADQALEICKQAAELKSPHLPCCWPEPEEVKDDVLSAALLFSHCRHRSSPHMDGVSRVAFPLALRAIFVHANKRCKDKLKDLDFWEQEPLLAFLVLVDDLQEFARIAWRVGNRLPDDPDFMTQIPLQAFLPIPRVEMNFDKAEILLHCPFPRGGYPNRLPYRYDKVLDDEKKERIGHAFMHLGMTSTPMQVKLLDKNGEEIKSA